MAARPLPRSFYRRPTVEVARDLLGKVLRHATPAGAAAGRIVEVEAYLCEEDPASHAFRGPTPRSRIMFEEGGRAYVSFSYGMHCCMNVVCHPRGAAGAVLLRALEPFGEGIDLMRRRRGREAEADLCSGPGKLTQALGITLAENGADLVRSALTIVAEDGRLAGRPPDALAIEASPRIGISRAQDRPLRFFVPGHPCVSR